MDVVVVESPAKAKTINKYLGDGYHVLASYGHVRDLSAKDGSVRPDDGFSMQWEVDARAAKHIKEIAAAVRKARRLYLATDPDREGEAISWHVYTVLDAQNALNGIDIKRVAFNEITRNAVAKAFDNPRELDQELIAAYLARRALDYLVGFTLSPVLWRKLPGSRSAGRVQSVALRLICERETEIEAFVSQEYWTVRAEFETDAGDRVTAGLTHLDGAKLDKLSLGDQAAADHAVAAIRARTFAVDQVERKQTRRHPAAPFITSTLQQEASRKLSFSAKQTMRLAQQLYEGVSIGGETVGLITYMRTDGVTMAQDAMHACRDLITADFGPNYCPEKPRFYKSKAKNAQEAHEAIRPTDVRRRPSDVQPYVSAEQLKLYTLIWKRTLASQMESALVNQVAVDIASPDRQVILRATGSVIAFDGFLKLYREGRDDGDKNDSGADGDKDDAANVLLPDLAEGEALDTKDVTPEQHFTQPPPRYTEASLVKRLEELGIGRPSTYASIISVLQDRKYVRLESRRFFPEDRGRLVTAFLASFFDRYVAYGFTADMEARLDDVSGGRLDWKQVLAEFWRDFSQSVDDIKGLRVSEVLDALDRDLGPHFFRDPGDGSDPRKCPVCDSGRLNLKLGKYGAFIGCSNYPECRHTRPLLPVRGNGDGDALAGDGGHRELGLDPATQQMVTLRKGPYGYYVQLGEASVAPAANGATDAPAAPAAKGAKASKSSKAAKAPKAPKAPKPKRASLPAKMDPEQVDLDRALALLALPRLVGSSPNTGEDIIAGLGRFGPYLKVGDTYVSLKGDDDVLTIGLNRAMELIARKPAGRTPARRLGEHPADNQPVVQRSGRYGPYVEHAGTRATIPADRDADAITLADAVALLAEKVSRAGTAAKAPKTAKAPAKTTKTTKAAKTAKTTKTSRTATKKTATSEEPDASRSDTEEPPF
jgi:DNA topoisomerase-1